MGRLTSGAIEGSSSNVSVRGRAVHSGAGKRQRRDDMDNLTFSIDIDAT
jgi:hypothetical protein